MRSARTSAWATAGRAEAYRTIATASGTVDELALYVAGTSEASALVLGLYADEGGTPTTLLGCKPHRGPGPGTWEKASVDIPGIVAGRAYSIGLLNPLDSTGRLRWHDSNEPGEPEQQSASLTLSQLPATWDPGPAWTGGPVSAYASGPGPAPVTGVSPTPATPTVAPPGPPPAGPVGAWGFDEPRGSTARDASGTGNRGRLSGAARTRGRYGGGLSFDGSGDWVTVGDDRSLDLTRSMTLEAWVRPTARGAGSILVKERSSRLSYALYSRPSGHVFTTAEQALRGSAALPLRRWSHVAMTWDGLVVRMYMNGRRVSSHALVGTAATSGGPLRIGGNAIWPEWFRGMIDEVRVYDRALTAAEIRRDRDTAVNAGAAAPKPTKQRTTRRATRRDVHRGTRWLSAGAAALRPG